MNNFHVRFNQFNNGDNLVINNLVFYHNLVAGYACNFDHFIPNCQASFVSLERERHK